MKNRNLKKKTIRLTAGVVALTTLAPLVNPIIPSFSNINQNKVLAADEETGKIIYTNPNPNGTKDAQGTINNAISKIEILNGESEVYKVLKISLVDDVNIRQGDMLTLKTEGGVRVENNNLRYGNQLIATARDQKDEIEPTAPSAVYENANSWEDFFEAWNNFKNSDKPLVYGKINVIFNKNIEGYNKNRYIKIPIGNKGEPSYRFGYKENELSPSQIETMKSSINKYAKIITPDNKKEDLFLSKQIYTTFYKIEEYQKKLELGEIFAHSLGKSGLSSAPKELQSSGSFSVMGGLFFGKYKKYVNDNAILKDSEIGKKFLNKGTILNLKLENTYYTSGLLADKKVGDIVENNGYQTSNIGVYKDAFKINSPTPLYLYGDNNYSNEKVKLKILKNDDTGISLELLQDLYIKGNRDNDLGLQYFRLNKLKSNFIDLIGEEKYFNFLQDRTQKELVNNKAKATISIIEPGEEEKILATQTGENLVKDPELAYGESTRGTVKVKYIDDYTGKELKPTETLHNQVLWNTRYKILPPKISKYKFIGADNFLQGIVGSGEKTITLSYAKTTEDELATITVNYVDEQGQKLQESTSIRKEKGEEYNIDKPEIQNYTFKSSSKPLTGTITDNDNITLTYSKDEKTLTVKYIHRSDNGEVEIKESKTERLEFDKDYSVDKPEIAGYKFKEADSDLTGKLTDNKVIKLYYSKYVPGPEGDKGEPGDKGQPGDKGESGKDNGGSPGRESKTPDIRIDPKTGNWIVNGKDTGISVFVKNGKDGKDGKDGNTDYNKVYIHYVDYNGNKTKDSEVVDKNKLQDKLKDENPQIAKEKDGNIIVVDKDKDNKDNKADNIIKYNIVSDKGEELSPSVYLSSKSEKPKPEIKGYKYLKTEKVSDNEERVIYTKDSEKSKDQITGDITYRLVDENNKPITTVYYQDDKFQPELDGYVFKEKIKISDKEYVLVYNKTKSETKDTQIKDTQTKDIKNTNKETKNLTDKELTTKLKSIIKDEDGNILGTQYLEKDVHPTIDGYKYKETKEIDKETQELIYTKDKVELKKADVKTGIEHISGSMIALFGTLIVGGLALLFKRRQNK